MYCHAGCDTRDILAKVGLQEKDLFNNVQEKPRVVAEYIYTDENNILSFIIAKSKMVSGWINNRYK